jgi:hypothetical protein
LEDTVRQIKLKLLQIKHIAANLLHKAPGKASFNMKSLKAAWDDDFRAKILTAPDAA